MTAVVSGVHSINDIQLHLETFTRKFLVLLLRIVIVFKHRHIARTVCLRIRNENQKQKNQHEILQ